MRQVVRTLLGVVERSPDLLDIAPEGPRDSGG